MDNYWLTLGYVARNDHRLGPGESVDLLRAAKAYDAMLAGTEYFNVREHWDVRAAREATGLPIDETWFYAYNVRPEHVSLVVRYVDDGEGDEMALFRAEDLFPKAPIASIRHWIEEMK